MIAVFGYEHAAGRKLPADSVGSGLQDFARNNALCGIQDRLPFESGPDSYRLVLVRVVAKGRLIQVARPYAVREDLFADCLWEGLF